MFCGMTSMQLGYPLRETLPSTLYPHMLITRIKTLKETNLIFHHIHTTAKYNSNLIVPHPSSLSQQSYTPAHKSATSASHSA